MVKPVELVLTCGSWQEAQRVADNLLGNKLVACVEMLEISSRFNWQSDIDEDTEIKLIMTTAAHLYDKIEAEIRQLHSYETFVLKQIEISHINQKAKAWLAEVVDN